MTQEGHEGAEVLGRSGNCEEVDRRKGQLRKQSRRRGRRKGVGLGAARDRR